MKSRNAFVFVPVGGQNLLAALRLPADDNGLPAPGHQLLKADKINIGAKARIGAFHPPVPLPGVHDGDLGVAAPLAGVQDDGLFLPVPVHIVEGEGGAVAAALGILKFDVLAHLLPEGAVHLILLFRELGGVQEILRSGGHGGTPGGQ